MFIRKYTIKDLYLNIIDKSKESQYFLSLLLDLLINKANIKLVGCSPFYFFFVPLLICVSLTISLAESSSLFLSHTFSETDDTTNRVFEQSEFQITNNYQKVIK